MKLYTFLNLLHATTAQLNMSYNHSALSQQHALWLLEHLYQKKRSDLIASPHLIFTKNQKEQLNAWIADLTIHKKPIDYIIGSVTFNDLTIIVEPPTLIPRPETEEWCMDLIQKIKTLHLEKITILDLATGSGCIGLALAHHLAHAHIIGTDISDKAIALAEKNRILNNISNITFYQSDLFETITDKKFDIIVSNPPYIAESERSLVDTSALLWEDEQALFASDDGLALIKKIIVHAKKYLTNNELLNNHAIPQLLIEIGYNQANLVSQLMLDAGYTHITVHKDMAQKNRVVTGRIDSVAVTKD